MHKFNRFLLPRDAMCIHISMHNAQFIQSFIIYYANWKPQTNIQWSTVVRGSFDK